MTKKKEGSSYQRKSPEVQTLIFKLLAEGVKDADIALQANVKKAYIRNLIRRFNPPRPNRSSINAANSASTLLILPLSWKISN